MICEISILLPSFNTNCYQLVCELARQASSLSLVKDLRYEILVAEDGSTNPTTIQSNKQIEVLENCRHIIREKNIGRAAIRNFLAREAKHKWLLFIDGDMNIEKNFILKYLQSESGYVVYGGYIIQRDDDRWKGNLRYKYETRNMYTHRCEERKKKPYNDFHTSNFLTLRSILLKFPFDERLREYGYEDVLWGRTLKENNIPITHIDAPAIFAEFENNTHFLQKTETALQTLYRFQDQLDGYSRLLSLAKRIDKLRLSNGFRRCFQALKTPLRKHLISARPSLVLFNLYKLGYFFCLKQ